MRLLAESSSVRSSHCVAAVIAVSRERAITCRASEQTRSARMGLRLYGMAEEPTCDASNGSSSSPSCCEQAKIGRELVRGLGEARERVDDAVVLLRE